MTPRKRLLIISPYFAPINAADMHRVRTSLPYYQQFGWEPEILTVSREFTDFPIDELLSDSADKTATHYVRALSKKITSKFGLGSIALRSLVYTKNAGNKLLATNKFDLVYFSTTQFPICILGRYWKKRFGVPYVIDMQDPWHSDYYLTKPKNQRPPKFWFSYHLNKKLESIAMSSVDGLISVSAAYIDNLKRRYPALQNIPVATITFGMFTRDLDIALANRNRFRKILDPACVNIVYIGRGGYDMHEAVRPLFDALANMLHDNKKRYHRVKLYFLGTSYAKTGEGRESIHPLAIEYGIDKQVIEETDRVSYYHALVTLQEATALFLPGSNDPGYTASKIFPYLMTGKPILSILHPDSPAMALLNEFDAPFVYSYKASALYEKISNFIDRAVDNTLSSPQYNLKAMSKYSSLNLTREQCAVFDAVLQRNQISE